MTWNRLNEPNKILNMLIVDANIFITDFGNSYALSEIKIPLQLLFINIQYVQ